METYINTERGVYHMEKDLRTGFILFADGSSLRIADGEDVATLVGSPSTSGYREDLGTEARFGSIDGFAQINDSAVIASGTSYNCLRLIDRDTLATSKFVGTCRIVLDNSYRDGNDALFNGPRALLLADSAEGLFVVDYGNDAVRYVNLITREVSTLLVDHLNNPLTVTYDFTREDLLIVDSHRVLRYNLCTQSLTVLSDTTKAGYSEGELSLPVKFNYPIEVLALSGSIILVVDRGNDRLRVINTTSVTGSSICTGHDYTIDGDIDKCALRSPKCLLLLDGVLYVGQYQAVRALPGTCNMFLY